MLSFTLEGGSDSVASPSGFLVLGQQPRHTACDRCRSQKVKCLKADSDNISACQRCQRAGADCAQTSTGRIGRPTTYNKRGKKLARRRSFTESPSELIGPSTTLKDMGSLQESAAEAEGESQAEENDQEHSSSTEGQDYDIERDDGFWRSSITSFDSQLSAHSEKQDPLDILGDPGTLNYDLFNFDMMCTATELSPIAIDSSIQEPLQLCSIGGLAGATTTSTQSGSSNTQAVNGDLIPTLGTHAHISNKSRRTSQVSKPTVQDLFLLTTSLEDLMEKTSRDPVKDPSGPLQLQDCHIDDILRTTQTFLDIIGAYLPPHEPSTTPGSPFDLSHDRPSDDAPRPPHTPDIHTYLIIVSCYTRILKVHSNLVYYIHERVQYGDAHPAPAASCSSAATASRATLPALQLGTTTIQDDVSLQAMLIVRIGARMIQRVEDVMGAMLSQHAGADGQAGTHHLSRSSTAPHVHHFRGGASPTASRQQGADGFGGRGQRGAGCQVNYMKTIVDSAICQEDRESLARGQSGIGSLEKTIEALEKLLR